jgi:hypothetical protein
MSRPELPVFVFVDTQVYESVGFNFNARDIERLEFYVSGGYICLFTTTVTRREIVSHIDAKSVTAYAALKSLRKEIAALYPFPDGLADIGSMTRDDLRFALQKRFEEFCVRTRIQVIPIDEVPAEDIMNAYFQRKPPFGDSKKKSEFPDAFAAAAIERWCQSTEKNMLVVSGDSDWEAICANSERLQHKPRLIEVFALFPDALIASQIAEGLKPQAANVTSLISEKFLNSGFSLYDMDGEAEDVDVLSIDLEEFLVVEAKDGQASIELVCTIHFSAHVSFDDPDSWIYDHEDKRAIYMATIKGMVKSEEEIEVELKVKYDESNPANLTIENVILPESDFTIVCDNVVEDDGLPDSHEPDGWGMWDSNEALE